MTRLKDFDVEPLARDIRCHALTMVHRARASHIGSCLSAADILAHLYGYWLRVSPENPSARDRDYFFLSKGHAAAALYGALAAVGFFNERLLQSYSTDGSDFAGSVSHRVPGVELSSGSLGHGLPVATGLALASKRTGRENRAAVLLSDGECDEGSVWEAALFAGSHRLDNLLAIVDYNKLQGFGRTDAVHPLEPFGRKWSAFGWNVREIDGHDHLQIRETLSAVPFAPGAPSVIIAHTRKGKGVPFMEDRLEWHYKSPTDDELAEAVDLLQAAR